MSVLNLKNMLKPESVALIGASDNHHSLGYLVMKNLLGGSFDGPIWPVNPKYDQVQGVKCFKRIADLPDGPDLAVIATPARTVPEIIREIGERGTRAAVILSAGFRDSQGDNSLEQSALDAAKPYGLRILGPNCVGLLLPNLGLNASFAHTDSLPGKLAMISQSGALCTTIIDWAKSRGIGFSHFISLGNGIDVDFGDLLDYLASDAGTHGILLYVESIKEARKFMSAARATARNKPVIVIKSGRVQEGAKAASSHTGALAGSDDVYDTAFRRAGILRVYTIEQLFDAVETLARARPVQGDRLAILTNGGGPGVLATDSLIAGGGQLAQLSDSTLQKLDAVLPANWSHGNPVDIIGDSDAERYVNALGVMLEDKGADAILVMLVPVAVIDNDEVARVVADLIRQSRKPIFTCWMGETAVNEAREYFEQQGIPSYKTPDSAVNAFLQMVTYQRNQQEMMQTPKSVPETFDPDKAGVAAIIERALQRDYQMLTEPEAKEVFSLYGIPVAETRTAGDVDEAIRIADDIGYPVVLKVLSPDITHKSDVGGVLLNISTRQLLRYSAEGMLATLRRNCPDARIEGFTVQAMSRRPDAYELIVGMTTDPIFGPVLLFGRGGTAVEVVSDKAVALPPLNMQLATDLMERTRIYRELQGYRDTPGVDMESLHLTLLKVSQLIIDHPQIAELDINPLFADQEGVIAVDARIGIKTTQTKGAQRLAIRPYPQELEESVALNDGEEVLLRPIRPEDEAAHHELFRRLTPQDIYFRFFRAMGDIEHRQLARYTQIDYDREMAFIATRAVPEQESETLGVVRAVSDADGIEAEFAILVRPDLQGSGLGRQLMEKLIRYCREYGIQRLVGVTLIENRGMRRLAEKYAFQEHFCTDGTVQLRLDLQQTVASTAEQSKTETTGSVSNGT